MRRCVGGGCLRGVIPFAVGFGFFLDSVFGKAGSAGVVSAGEKVQCEAGGAACG